MPFLFQMANQHIILALDKKPNQSLQNCYATTSKTVWSTNVHRDVL